MMDDNQFKGEVMNSLGRIEGCLPAIKRDITELQSEQKDQGKEIAALKVKTSLIGTISGAISGFIVGLIK